MRMDLEELKSRIRAFAKARDWEKFHTPKNLAMALVVESAELLENFQWLTEDESQSLSVDKRQAISHEMADVMIYLARLADIMDIDLDESINEKLAINEAKYPADQVRGSAKKYTEYE